MVSPQVVERVMMERRMQMELARVMAERDALLARVAQAQVAKAHGAQPQVKRARGAGRGAGGATQKPKVPERQVDYGVVLAARKVATAVLAKLDDGTKGLICDCTAAMEEHKTRLLPEPMAKMVERFVEQTQEHLTDMVECLKGAHEHAERLEEYATQAREQMTFLGPMKRDGCKRAKKAEKKKS